MRRAGEIYEYLKELAPLELQMDFDNSGFQLGRLDAEINKALLALDVTEEVVGEAIELGAQLIISHHPLIFSKLRNITDTKLLRLAENRIAVISMHTNLDIAAGGVNDVLITLLGARADGPLDPDDCGRVGELPEAQQFDSFLRFCKTALDSKGLRYYNAGRPVKRLAVMGGSGGDYIGCAAEKGCDTYVTADIKYHQFLEAKELGINLIDGDHFCTENPVIPSLCEKLRHEFPDVCFTVSASHGQVISFI